MAVSVRALLEAELKGDVRGLDEVRRTFPWLSRGTQFTEQAKFDSGPYLTTVLGLDWVVSRVLDTSPIPDFTSYSAVGKQLTKLEGRLGIYLQNARERLDEARASS